MNKFSLNLFADYFQLYLMDVESQDDTSDIWTDQALDFKLAIMRNTVAVGTFRNVDVTVEIELHDEEPSLDLEEWDHAALGYIEIKSGKCAVFGCTDYLPDAKKIDMVPGIYSVLSLAKGLDTITEEWEDAGDLYRVVLWPSMAREYKVLKNYGIT
jgi:hypothetical protein